MKQLLEASKEQLFKPLGHARRKLLIILNGVYLVLVPFFLISEKVANGSFVHDSIMYPVYGTALVCNFVSLVYNVIVFYRTRKHTGSGDIHSRHIFFRNQKELDDFFGYASILPILWMSVCNMIGIGNPFSDSLFADFALAQSLMIVVVMIIGRSGVFVWFIIVLAILCWNVSARGWDYEYHYATPSEAQAYRAALDKGERWALDRQAELAAHKLQPPKVSRYFNTWFIFLLVAFLVSYFYSGVTLDVFKIMPSVIHNMEQASEESTRMELERKFNEEKTETFISLAHETKTPLTLINNYLEEYIDRHGTTRELNIVKWNVQRLTTDMINFFDVERFNKGLPLYHHDQVCNITEILQNKLPLFHTMAANREVKIEEIVHGGGMVQAHPGAVERIINNLIENAIKYTPAGGRVTVFLITENDHVCFQVTDTGVGIPAHLQQHIFEPYVQVGNLRTREGMGMGLPIVKKIVIELNGNIVVESRERLGTRVCVELPLHADTPVASTGATPPAPETLPEHRSVPTDKVSDPQRPYILVVEDNIDLLTYVADRLAARYNIYVARNGAEALDRLPTIPRLDLIISDIMMDTMDGLELCQRIVANDAYRHIPFIFLTARNSNLDRLAGLQLGAVQYIEKPFMIEHVIAMIESILKNLEHQRSAVVRNAYTSLLQQEPVREQQPQPSAQEKFELNCKRFNLTDRQVEIAGAIAQGRTNKEIADIFNISPRTVDRHVQDLFEKVSVNKKTELVNRLYGIT